MATYVWRKGKCVDKKRAGPKHVKGSAPSVISDIMDTTQHMATGRMHTSKSEFRKDTKASGCVEYGNDAALYRPKPVVPLDRGKRREDIRRALYDVRNR